MTRLIRDFVQIGDFGSLDQLIEQLTELRDNLPPEAEAEIRMRGDEAFGRHLCVVFKRPLSAEEAACEGRYVDSGRPDLKVAA